MIIDIQTICIFINPAIISNDVTTIEAPKLRILKKILPKISKVHHRIQNIQMSMQSESPQREQNPPQIEQEPLSQLQSSPSSPLGEFGLNKIRFFDHLFRKFKLNKNGNTYFLNSLDVNPPLDGKLPEMEEEANLFNQISLSGNQEKQIDKQTICELILESYHFQFIDQSIGTSIPSLSKTGTAAQQKNRKKEFTQHTFYQRDFETLKETFSLGQNEQLSIYRECFKCLQQPKSVIRQELGTEKDINEMIEWFTKELSSDTRLTGQNKTFLMVFDQLFDYQIQSVVFPFIYAPPLLQDILHPFLYMYEMLRSYERILLEKAESDRVKPKSSVQLPKVTFLNLDGFDSVLNWEAFQQYNHYVQLISVIDEDKVPADKSKIQELLQCIRPDQDHHLIIPLNSEFMSTQQKKVKNEDENKDENRSYKHKMGDQEFYYIFQKIHQQIKTFQPKIIVISYSFQFNNENYYLDPSILGEFVYRFTSNCTKIVILPRLMDNTIKNSTYPKLRVPIPYACSINSLFNNNVVQAKKAEYIVDCLQAMTLGTKRQILTERARTYLDGETGKSKDYYYFKQAQLKSNQHIRSELYIKQSKQIGLEPNDPYLGIQCTELAIKKINENLAYQDKTNLRGFISLPTLYKQLQALEMKLYNSVTQSDQIYLDDEHTQTIVFQGISPLNNQLKFIALNAYNLERNLCHFFSKVDLEEKLTSCKVISQPFIPEKPPKFLASAKDGQSFWGLDSNFLVHFVDYSTEQALAQAQLECKQNSPIFSEFKQVQSYTMFVHTDRNKPKVLVCIGGEGPRRINLGVDGPLLPIDNPIYVLILDIVNKEYRVERIDNRLILPHAMTPNRRPLVIPIYQYDIYNFYLVIGGEQDSIHSNKDVTSNQAYLIVLYSSRGYEVRNIRLTTEKNLLGITSTNTIMLQNHPDDLTTTLVLQNSLRTSKLFKRLKSQPERENFIQYFHPELAVFCQQSITIKINKEKFEELGKKARQKFKKSLASMPFTDFLDMKEDNFTVQHAGFQDPFLQDKKWYAVSDPVKLHAEIFQGNTSLKPVSQPISNQQQSQSISDQQSSSSLQQSQQSTGLQQQQQSTASR